MTTKNNFDEKDDRQQRFQRRRGQTQAGLQDDAPRSPRRSKPYKRDNVNYNDYLQEEQLEDDWFDENS